MILDDIGSQCKSKRTGVMWECFLVKVTTRAAVFWMRWRRESCLSGRPNTREFPMSSRDVTNEWTICSVELRSRYFRIFPMLRIWNEAERTVWEMWLFRDMDESKITPRLRAWSTGLMWESPTVTNGMETLDNCCGEPTCINMNSVLVSLIFKKLSFIHWRMSSIHDSIQFIADSACC